MDLQRPRLRAVVYLLDTNIIVRLPQRTDPAHTLVRTALRRLWQRGEALSYTSQNLVEFWNVNTRPPGARGGYGLSLSETDRRARLIERFYTLLPDSPAVHQEWRRLVVAHSVSGVQVHDARLVAFMLVHSVTHVLTLNPGDFARYASEGITAVHPSTV